MGRTVVTKRDIQNAQERARAEAAEGKVASASTASQKEEDTYRDRLVKYIPADIVAIYLALTRLVKTAQPDTVPITTIEWVVFGVILALTIPWQRKVVKVKKRQQVAIGTVAFMFWAISLGDPFDISWKGWYRPLYGTMGLMLYTFMIPLFEAESSSKERGA